MNAVKIVQEGSKEVETFRYLDIDDNPLITAHSYRAKKFEVEWTDHQLELEHRKEFRTKEEQRKFLLIGLREVARLSITT